MPFLTSTYSVLFCAALCVHQFKDFLLKKKCRQCVIRLRFSVYRYGFVTTTHRCSVCKFACIDRVSLYRSVLVHSCVCVNKHRYAIVYYLFIYKQYNFQIIFKGRGKVWNRIDVWFSSFASTHTPFLILSIPVCFTVFRIFALLSITNRESIFYEI